MSQFPIPFAHAHEDVAPENSRLASHIESKHCNGHDETACLHWHLVMPWETGDQEAEETPTHHPSPLGLWGAEGNVLPQSETITARPLIAQEWVICDSGDTSTQATGSRRDASARPASLNFTQTYLGVPLCTLVCVCLR